ncbi:methylthioribulose 1-phosphate dehydratase [Floridanema aerugineum]|uniref:Methylthioribulose-1-phosphate dehydratase n=1 Tax=Floridaenema aerugineum BLCC-F46 TaxID=3153654 RepID=A0ABV4XDR1_9CYAN
MSVPDLRLELMANAEHFYKQGWMAGTAGNLSARLPDGSFWITASGKSKGNLNLTDFVKITPDGIVESLSNDLKPSAETAIHQTIYKIFPEAQACYHVHSIEANLVSRFVEGDTLLLPPLEMLKGFNIWQENLNITLSIFPNHFDVSQIAREIKECFQLAPPQIPALLIRDHGVTVWADSTEKARNFIELIEYLFRYIVAASQTGVKINPYV